MTLPTKATKMKEGNKKGVLFFIVVVFYKHIVKVLESKDPVNPQREVNSRNPEVTEEQGDFHPEVFCLGQET